MVSTRRKIVSEQDRFGGYSRQPSVRVSIDDANDVEYSGDVSANFMDEPIRDTVVIEKSAAQDRQYTLRRGPVIKKRENIVEYSTRTETPTEEFSTISAPKKLVTPRRREREDLMPSIKTRAYNKDMSENIEAPSQKTRSGVSPKARLMLAVYMVVVVILAALVIATGIAVSNINSDVNSLQGEILAKNQQIISQNSVIDKITDENYIAGIAGGKDMEKVDSVVSVDKLPIVEPIKYESRTNWFDIFCDWLQYVFGG